MLNHVTLLGRLAQDPELRTTQSGVSMAYFDLAVQVPSKDKDVAPDWIPVVCWRDTAEMAARYLSRGRQIVVEGRISTRKYTARDGSNRKVVEVTASRLYFADSNGGSNAGSQNNAPAEAMGSMNAGFTEVDDEELPF